MVAAFFLALIAQAPALQPGTSGSLLSDLLPILLGAGGAGGIAGLISAISNWRDKIHVREETLIVRLNAGNKAQADRADRAEADCEKLRKQRDRARDLASRYHSRMLVAGMEVDESEFERLYGE